MFDCVVIGAGPGGLVATKELLEQGISNIVCLEKMDHIGGIFTHAYDSLKLTSSCTYSMFSDFWMGDGKTQDFWTKAEAVDYWQNYAEHFGVLARIHFQSEVNQVTLADNHIWKIRLQSGEELCSQRIVLAIGNNTVPHYPSWVEKLTHTPFIHSSEFRNADGFAGKNVLIVGGGESGSDIALEISRVAKNCWISLRNSAGWILPRKRGIYAADIATHRGLYGLPRNFGVPLSKLILLHERSQNDPIHNTVIKLNEMVQSKNKIWGIYGTKNFSLPHAIVDYGCTLVDEIVKVKDDGKNLVTASHQILKEVDYVIFGTGYRNHIDFLPDPLQDTDPRSLYKHMFHPQFQDKIAWIGWARPSYGSQFPIMEMQARYFSLICNQQKTLPDLAHMGQVISEDQTTYLNQFEHHAVRIRSLVDYHIYMDSMAKLIGCRPPLWQYFFLHPRIWLRLVYGATQATQFRLRGPGQKKVLAQEIIMRLPVSPFNHVVKAGIRGRFIYMLKPISDFFMGMLNSYKAIVKKT